MQTMPASGREEFKISQDGGVMARLVLAGDSHRTVDLRPQLASILHGWMPEFDGAVLGQIDNLLDQFPRHRLWQKQPPRKPLSDHRWLFARAKK